MTKPGLNATTPGLRPASGASRLRRPGPAGGDPPNLERGQLGQRLNRMRKERRLTLDDTARLTGVARSTLSKIENGQMSPTYDLLSRITASLDIDLVTLFDNHPRQAHGARSITLNGQGTRHVTDTYSHQLLATDLSRKAMLPFKTIVVARSLEEFPEWVRHKGEEFLMVLSGRVEVHTEIYAPVALGKGDSVYFDSNMGHAVLSLSKEDAEVIWVCSGSPSFPDEPS